MSDTKHNIRALLRWLSVVTITLAALNATVGHFAPATFYATLTCALLILAHEVPR